MSQKVEKVQKGGGRAGNFCGTQEPTETIYSFAVSFWDFVLFLAKDPND